MGKNQQVKKRETWVVKPEGANTPRSHHHTQANAIKAAIPFAKKAKAEVVIHRAEGTIRDRDSYGDESNKRDTKH